MSAWVSSAAAALLSAVASPTGDVHLVPFHCGGLSDQELRPLLKVELRARLRDESAPAAPDSRLVSVACDDDLASIMSVRQAEGLPVRRRVALGGVSPEARPRTVAVAIAELLRTDAAAEMPIAPAFPVPSPPTVVSDERSEASPQPAGGLQLVEPLILMPLSTDRRAGVRTRVGNADVPTGAETPNYYVLSVEPFLDLALGHRTVGTLVLPVTWTEGPSVSSWGQLANLTASIRHVSGDELRVGIGASLSLGGRAPAAQGESNLFELDRFRYATSSLRLQSDALWRADRLYLQGELAVLVLADAHRIGTLLRSGMAAGLAFSRGSVGAEYVVLSDVLNEYFARADRFVQALILGTRWQVSRTATLGVHAQVALDQGPNLAAAGALSAAWTF